MQYSKTMRLVLAAVLTGIIVLMGFTPLGYLRLGLVEITFLMIPVVIGASLLGQWYGLYLGAVFGLTSFAQCFTGSLFGAALIAINPIGTFITCLLPRMLMGLLTGLLFRWLSRIDKTKFISFAVTSVCGAAFNTVLFIGCLLLFFYNALYAGMSIGSVIISFLSVNTVLEIIVCGIVGTALSKVLVRFLPKKKEA